MAETEIPDGTTWATHQHVIMAINIKSMNDFEPADGATTVFYGSNTPFKITGAREPGQPITINGTKVKTYGSIKPGTPVLLVTRVRDVDKDRLTDLDKRYIVCSNLALAENTITATIEETVYNDWNSLPNLTKHYMDKYKDIFARRNKDTELRKELITSAIKSTKSRFDPESPANIARAVVAEQAKAEVVAKPAKQEVATKKAAVSTPVAPQKAVVITPIAPQKVVNLPPPDYTHFNSAYEFFQSPAYKTWAKTKDPLYISQVKGRINDYFANKFKGTLPINRTTKKFGGSPNDDLTSLDNLVSNNEDGFKKYVYFLLMQPFYFKLNALTPESLNNIKNSNLSGGSTGTFDSHILQPFVKFSYVKYVNKVTKQDDLIKHLSELIEHQTMTPVENFTNQIIKDTTNYKKLTNTNDNGYYIHIVRFIELIDKTLKKHPSTKTGMPMQVNDFIKYALNKIHEHMMHVKSLFYLLISVDNILISDGDDTQPTKTEKQLHIYIDDYVSSQNRTDVITYLKINNTEPAGLSNNKSWNQRYDIRLKQAYMARESKFKFNAMILGYKMYPDPFYKQVSDETGNKRIVAVDGLDGTVDTDGNPNNDRIVTYKTTKITYNEIDKVNAYDKYYLFGNYENIFPLYNIENGAKETNLENAKRMTAIIEQICTHKKPVFLLGYGASGSGKTSSLIYFNNGKTPDEQNGIVIHLCKEIIEKLNAPADPTASVKSIKVVVKEFYVANELQTLVSGPYVFKPDLTYQGDIGQPKHAYHVNMNKPIETFETMGQVLKQLVDVDRYVKATTNNPQSSRSHVLVFIQFCSDDEGNVPIRNLIIGDFAGKENAFQCADTNTVVAFLNKKVENREIVDILNKKLPIGSAKPETYTFYGAQLMQSGGDVYANDPIDELVSVVDDNLLTQDELDNRRILQTASGMLFDFEKPSNSINKADINNPETYDSFKLTADQYAPIVIKYFFNDKPVPTDVQPTAIQPLNNSRIYDNLLNSKDKFDNLDKGIDIFNIYAKAVTSVDKRAHLLQHLIFEDLFEADHISNVITDDVINNYTYNNTLPINSSTGSGSGNYQIVSAMQNISNMIADKDNLGLKLIDNESYPEAIFKTTGTGVSNKVFTDSITKFNSINTILYKKSDKPVFNAIINQPKYFTIANIKNDILDKFTSNNATWKIAGKKMFPYKDPLDRNKEKSIPIVKSFTISTMCEYFMTNRFKSLLPFFKEKQSRTPINLKQPSKKPTETAANIYYDKRGHNYVNEFKYILDSLNAPDNDLNHYIKLIDIYQKNITISQVRLKHGKQVCENRLMEGNYINTSLDKTREAIKYILSKKHENSDALFHSPDFIDICLQSYCPTGINCFKTAISATPPESLIDEIYKHLYPVPNDDTKNKFYTDIVISVLCVFNISRLADNPPTVPYIDINQLKQIFYNTDSAYSQQYPLLWALHNLKIQIDYLRLDHKPFSVTLNTLIKSAKDSYNPNEMLTITGIDSDEVMKLLTSMINAIDIHNAASAIGTLEFLDQLAKFNSVNNLCYKNTGDSTTPYLDDSEYKTYAKT
jgi:hypothetical protein